jgi:hypothetical protein
MKKKRHAIIASHFEELRFTGSENAVAKYRKGRGEVLLQFFFSFMKQMISSLLCSAMELLKLTLSSELTCS